MTLTYLRLSNALTFFISSEIGDQRTKALFAGAAADIAFFSLHMSKKRKPERPGAQASAQIIVNSSSERGERCTMHNAQDDSRPRSSSFSLATSDTSSHIAARALGGQS